MASEFEEKEVVVYKSYLKPRPGLGKD